LGEANAHGKGVEVTLFAYGNKDNIQHQDVNYLTKTG